MTHVVFILACLSILVSTDCYIRSNNHVQSAVQRGVRDISRRRPNLIGSSAARDNNSLKMSSGTPEALATPNKYAEDIKRTAVWAVAAALFGFGITAVLGPSSGIEFASGYVLEQCLSVDNLFVFLLLFDYFKIEKQYEEKILNYGIWGAIVLRGIFIGAGSVALQEFHQVLLLFAAVLFYSSYKILFKEGEEEDDDLSQNAVVKFAKSYFKTTDQFDGNKFFTNVEVPVEEGSSSSSSSSSKSKASTGVLGEVKIERLATPLFLCLVCVELSDVVFAFDSVPAIFGVTQNAFIVYTSNIFAICGLRSLYGVLSEAVSELEYLEKAVGVVLAVVATKMSFGTFDIEILTPLQSLLVVVGLLGGGVYLSLNGSQDEEAV